MDGTTTHGAGSLQDPERQKADLAQGEIEARYRILAEASPVILWARDAYGAPEFVNRAFRDFYGVTLAEAEATGWWPPVHPEDAPLFEKVALSAIREHKPFSAEARVRRADGEWRWMAAFGQPRFGEAGEFLGHVGVSVDVTDRKRAEEALRQSEKKLRVSVANAAIGFVVTTTEGCILEANPAYCAITGYGIEELRSIHPRQFIHPDDYAENQRQLDRMVAGEISDFVIENRYRRKDGDVVWVRKSTSVVRDALGEPQWEIVLVEDISKRKRAEELLRESEEHFRAFVTASSDVVYRTSPDWSELRELRGGEFVVPPGAPGHGWLEKFIHPDDRPRVVEVIREAIRTKGVFQLEHRVLQPDGSVGWTFSRAIPFVDACGAVMEWFGAASDITARKRADEALRESEERLRLFIEHAPAAVAMFDREMRYLVASRRFLGDFKLSLSDVLGRSHYEVFPEVPERWKQIHRRCLAGAVETCDEDPFPRADGTLDWVRWEIHPWHTAAGEIGGIILFSELITERKRAMEALRESEERFRLLVRGVKDCAIYMLAPDGTVSSWSAAAEQILGYGEEEIVGQHRRVFFTHEQVTAGRPQRDLEEALALGSSEEEGWRVRKDGSRFWANVLITALRDDGGRLRGFASVMRDFTVRKRAENALRESEERLRASEAALREADRQKNRFLATLSHELRNPLAPIRNSLHILDRAAPGGEQAKRAQAIIQRQIGQMTLLIDDLLDVTRIAHGKIQLRRERLDLDDLARRTVEDHRVVFARSDVLLEVLPAPAEVWVDGDRVRLAQVISNLLQNAVKFTPHGGRTTVSLQADSARGQAILTVRDTGAGIQPEMLPRLFQPFAQADATLDRSKGGLGLGLALVRGLVEMHGGSVSVASNGPGTGAAFSITLPLDVSAARVLPAWPDVGSAAPRRVLVIEDNQDAANSLREVLELDEHVVEVAYTGREGLEKVHAFHPDVVLCDIGLPEMDGYEVARRMRSDPELNRVALVAVSGYAQPEDVEMAREAGFDAHLAKPPSIDTLERALAEVGRDGVSSQRSPMD
jgi:PAS domain S-box-containing protein